jgi:hypothetical protein
LKGTGEIDIKKGNWKVVMIIVRLQIGYVLMTHGRVINSDLVEIKVEIIFSDNPRDKLNNKLYPQGIEGQGENRNFNI